MQRILLVVLFSLLGFGCAAAPPESNSNNSGPPGVCQTQADCNSDQVCCEVPGSPVVNGDVLAVCSAPNDCCNCFAPGSCDRCDSNEECFVEVQGVGECRPLPCLYPTCSSNEDCSPGELCCSALTSQCEGCQGACMDPAADECTTAGYECGGGPYAAAEPPNKIRGAWKRQHQIIPLPASHLGHATISATFQWQHDAGRPPPHDFAIGMGNSRSPVFQVFGRNGRSFARFGLQLVQLDKDQLYRLSLSIEPDGKTTRAQLVRLGDRLTVMTTSVQAPSRIRSIWREQLSPLSRSLDARLDLREFWIQHGSRIGWSMAQRPSSELQDACGTSI